MILLSRNKVYADIIYADIRWGSLGRGVKLQWGCRRRHFWLIRWLLLRKLWRQGQHYYMAISNLLPGIVIDCKMNDLE